ncbi:MAG: hypothetical protein ACK56I_00370, partial [bacterium]
RQLEGATVDRGHSFLGNAAWFEISSGRSPPVDRAIHVDNVRVHGWSVIFGLHGFLEGGTDDACRCRL